MRTSLVALLVALAVAAFASPARAEDPKGAPPAVPEYVDWKPTVAEAADLAKKENKPLFVAINVAVFVVMAANGVSARTPTPDDLVRWGANTWTRSLDDQPWRRLYVVLGKDAPVPFKRAAPADHR